jgi:hypothetical protein
VNKQGSANLASNEGILGVSDVYLDYIAFKQ